MKQKLLIVVSNLNVGGAQRFIVNLANDIHEQYDINILSVHASKEPNFISELSANISYYSLNTRALKSINAISRFIVKFQPDIMFSTQSYINSITLLAKWKSGHACRLIIREASIISNKNSPTFYAGKFLYKKADKIIAQTSSIKQDIIKNFSCNSDNIVVLPNYISPELLHTKANENSLNEEVLNDKFKFLFCGRLEQVKNVDRLLSLFNEFYSKQQDFEFWVVGDGSQRQILEQYCVDNELRFVRFFGFQKNPYKFMKEADCLLLASYREGFPNVVVEAMNLNCIILTNDFKGGAANDILKGELSNYIYHNKFEFKKISSLILKLSKSERDVLKSKFKNRSLAYKKEGIIEKYLA